MIREELIEIIRDHIIDMPNYMAIVDKQDNIDDYPQRVEGILDLATLDQLWSLYKACKRGQEFELIQISDHLGIRTAGMYVGIEPDGYMHS